MLDKMGLLNVDERSIEKVEVKKASIIQKIARNTWWVVFLSTFVLWYNWQIWWGVLAFFGSIVIMGIGDEPAKRAKEIANNKKYEKLNELLTLRGINCSQKYITEKFDFAIVLDGHENRLCLVDYEIREFSFSDILEVEIVEDEIQITKTSRGSQLGGAIVGGVLAGGIGAVIGGVTGSKSTSNDKVRRIYIKMIVNDMQRPFVTINFLNEKKEILKKDKKAMKAINDANHWYSLISVIIKRAG
ncbi:hypothetical protein MJA45_03160 [Paenibacillus aurantius]|uniref:Uncharacterized protein n=1 Tax=Paenibacillus aurantius TaxID=2918900 RepID=A0AA96LHG5_9BACL|nr:hypothetical protein [Paenibacillus aurantius]WNQ12076.1 hypothetical protein MJA45_03160 [Paenibacillus aurantius]